MKKSYSLFLTTFLFLSLIACEDETAPATDLEERYSHDIPNCDNGGNFEINCTEWIEFVNGSEAEVLIGGSDIVEHGTYQINGNQIAVTFDPQSSLSLIFERLDANRLRRIDDGSIWSRD